LKIMWSRFLGFKFSYLEYTLDEGITTTEFLFMCIMIKLEGSYMVS